MNRRGFLRRLMIAAVAAPIAAPVVMKVAKEIATPKSSRWGYKGAQFMEAGIVYAPYIPLYQTCQIVSNPIREIPKKLNVRWSREDEQKLQTYLDETVEKYYKHCLITI